VKRKIKATAEVIFGVSFMFFACAMDSPNMLIPVIGVIVSLLGLLIASSVRV